jgi:hypothetical protein
MPFLMLGGHDAMYFINIDALPDLSAVFHSCSAWHKLE